ncbi:uncharacterized protein LOC115442387 isoform X2 [Manduca sexta]|uniref:uncharacterized protein LOC115442387 isoform X2 n=1 Tax=Manduca sexta TaxID=7130 RepID=UPI001183F22F|nr:uncharacterized protein LOC115442387 isoform X2 [Manduca sexta]
MIKIKSFTMQIEFLSEGPGLWNILNIYKYEGEGQDEFYLDYDIVKRRLNRTHEGYNISCDLQKDFDDSHAMHIDICKKVDGGCKPYQILDDDSVVHFIEQHSKENLENLLTAAGVDPPEFPIPKGKYTVNNFIIDYCDLPPNGPYGEYEAVACIMKDAVKALCVVTNVEFVEDDDDVCGRND